MAQTTGLVQSLKITTGEVLAHVYIGPSPTAVTALFVSGTTDQPTDISVRTSMVEALSRGSRFRQASNRDPRR